MSTPLHQLADYGQSPWIDYIDRRLRPQRRPEGSDRARDRRTDV